MYQASTEFASVVSGNSRTFNAKIVSGSDTITSGIKKYKYNGGSNGDDNITIGSTVSAYVEMEISNPEISLENKEIQLFTGLPLSSGIEYIPVGKFIVQKPEKDGKNIRITAYDKMSKAAGMPYFSDLTYPATAIQILDEICSKLGISRATTGLGTITIPTKPEGYTCREMIGYIAALYGKFACINRQGNLEIRWYEDKNYSVGPGKYVSLQTNENNFTVNKIDCSVDNNTTLTAGSGYTGISISNPLMTQDRLNFIYNVLNGFTFRPGACKFLGDPRLDPWDIVTVTDLYGKACKIPCMVLIQEYDGGISTTVEAKGKTEEESKNDFKGPTTKAIERTYVELMLVKTLLADKANIEYLQANYATINSLTAVTGRIDKLESSQITTSYLTANYAKIDLANIAAGTIKTAMIDTAAIGTTQIADGSITDAKIVALTASKITAGRLDAGVIDVVNLNAANITVGTINGQQIASGAIDLTKIDAVFNTTLSSKITSSQAQGIADTAVGNLQIGGRNLFKGSKDGWTSTQYNILNQPALSEPWIVGQTYTVTIKGTINSGQKFGIWSDAGSNGLCMLTYNAARGLWIGTGAVTGIVTGLEKQISVWNFPQSGATSATIEWIKVEKGTKATDWTPAPEDVDVNIVKAQSTADGKNTVFYATTAPTAKKPNDVWFNTSDSNKISYWNGSTWALSTLGTNALADLSITNAKIADATIQNAKIANLDAAKITTGYLSSDRIATGSILIGQLANSTITGITDTIQIGGRNLVLNSNKGSSSLTSIQPNGAYTVSEVSALGVSTATKIACTVAATRWQVVYANINKPVLKANTKYTLSFDFYSTIAMNLSMYIMETNGLNCSCNFGNKNIPANTWTKVVMTATSNSTAITNQVLYMTGFMAVGEFTFVNLKMEEGDKALPWTPALEDTNALISAASIANWCYSNNLTYINGAKLYTGTVAATAIVANSITAAQIAANTITATQIAVGTITANLIASRTITADKIVTGAITANEIAAATITGTKIAANTITAANLNVASLSAITANLGTVTAGILQSTNYIANTSGMKLTLDTGVWDSKYFKISTDGSITATAGNLAGFTISSSGLSSTSSEAFPIYTQADIDKMSSFIFGTATPTEADLVRYDINGDRQVANMTEMLHVGRISDGSESNIVAATLNINPNSVRKMIELKRTSGAYTGNQTILGAGNIYTDGLSCADFYTNYIVCKNSITSKGNITVQKVATSINDDPTVVKLSSDGRIYAKGSITTDSVINAIGDITTSGHLYCNKIYFRQGLGTGYYNPIMTGVDHTIKLVWDAAAWKFGCWVDTTFVGYLAWA